MIFRLVISRPAVSWFWFTKGSCWTGFEFRIAYLYFQFEYKKDCYK